MCHYSFSPVEIVTSWVLMVIFIEFKHRQMAINSLVFMFGSTIGNTNHMFKNAWLRLNFKEIALNTLNK